ncbi:MAG: PT domain-containing protein, partial [Oscillospiraceae bacterium]|nr:PT domain-containing protein [Oscillospiraceae bacterium]
MVVGTLPASALNTGSTEENVITAGTPSLGVKDVAVASGEEAAIEVTISDAVPLNSFTLNLLIDGENVDTFTAANGGTGADAEVGPVYEKLTSTAFNPEAGKFAATLQADEDVTGSDGDTLLVFYLDTKGIQDGKYTLSLEGVKLGDSSRNEWTTEAGTLTTTTGILTIGDVPEDATTAPTPTQAPTQAATQAATSAPTPEGFAVGLKDVTVAKSGDEAIIEVIVNDPVPFNSFTLNLQIDGKSLDAFGGTGTDAEVGEVYEKLSNSAFNPAVGKFAANYQADDDVAGSTGDTLLVIYFDTTGVPDGEYVMSLDGVKIGNSNRDEWTVGNGLSTFTGILKIGDTDTPTEAEEPTQAPTVAPSGMSLGLNDVTVKAGEEAVIEFAIKNPEPLNSFTATLLIDGKSVDVFGGTGTDAEVGTVYEKLSNSAFNPAVGKFAANYQADDDVAGADGDVLLNFYFDTTGVPAGEYTMSLEGVKIGNSNRDEWTVEAGTMSTFTGILTILDEEPTDEPTEEPTEAPTEEPTDEPTEAPTEAPTDAPTEAPTEAPTDAPTEEPFTHVTQDTDAQWVIGTTTVEAGEDAVISVSVNGDTDGLNSYIVRLAQDAGPVLKSAEQATAYAELGFEKNTDNLVFGGTNFSTKENVTGDGDVITLTFSTDDLEPGIYNVTFVDDTVEIYNVEMVQLVPKTQNGWIEIVAPETTPEETDAPTEAPTEAETEAETEDIVAPEWIIGTATVEAGEDATITVAVTGDTTGLNSYIVKLSQDAGPVLKSAEQATAYAELGFEKNMEALTFGGTNFSTKTNVTGEGDVITLTFGTDDLEPGIYNVVFVDDTVEIYTVGMNQVVPNTTNGWIEIVAPETTPEETDAPTEPETDAPTEPETDAPTEPETEAPTEPETEAPT